jgi:hypothetical protein
MSKGVFFLANDDVFDLVVAFLNSLRRHNPDLPACFIPFDERAQRVSALSRTYGFTTFADAALLSECDAVSARFHGGSVMGHYRKLAIWEGPFDEFIYIDVDTVILRALDFVFGLLPRYPILTSHSHIDGIVKWVWRRSIRRQRQLTMPQIAFAANTGFIASRRGVIGVDVAKKKVGAALELLPHMVLECKEQSFLNYLIVTSGVKYSSLRVLAHGLTAAGVPHRLSIEHWAGNRHAMVEAGRVRALRHDTPLLLMHWAGEWQPRRWELLLFQISRRLRRTSSRVRPSIRRRLPYGDLWCYYRSLPPNNPG